MQTLLKFAARLLLIASMATICLAPAFAADGKKPNVIVILADDVGYGDLSCYGAKQIKTPNLDRLAAEGLRFTDGHAASATCTPTRYALLTGEYPWRKPGTGILPGDANLIIEPGRFTLPALFQKAGYATGAVGKWHLGLGKGPIDWNGEIKPGPREIGFSESFLIPATGDRVPCVYVENGRVVGLDPKDPIQVSYGKPIGEEPTGKDNPELLKMKLSAGHDMTIVNGISRIGYMTGGKSARWVDEDMADVITRRAVKFIEDHQAEPFFLYFATHDAHVPRAPHARYAGKSGCGVRGDVIQELDGSVGEVMAALERLKIADNTLIIFSSDNGPVIDDGYADGAARDLNGHTPAGVLRGGKYSLFEGGHRVPFLARWPAKIKPAVSDKLICQIDLLATFADLLGQALPENAAPDSLALASTLLNEAGAKGRDHLVSHAAGLAIRRGPWKLIPAKPPGMGKAGKPGAAGGTDPLLFQLPEDPSEQKNVAKENAATVEAMQAQLKKIRESGRSRS